MEIRRLCEAEAPRALALAQQVFFEFVAQDYSAKGQETFLSFVTDANAPRSLRFYGAFEGEALAGMLAMRGNGHISLFFVERAYQRRGVGRALFRAALRESPAEIITVHSSPYARPIYEKLGFTTICGEQLTDGIRYFPMKYVRKPADE